MACWPRRKNGAGQKIPERELIVTQYVFLGRVSSDLKISPGELLKTALIRRQSVTGQLVPETVRQKLSRLLNNSEFSATAKLEEFFLHYPGNEWLLKAFNSGRFTWQEVEKIFIAKTLTRARAEVEFLIPGRPKFKDAQEIWGIIKEFWPEENSLKSKKEAVDWRKFAVAAIPLNEEQPKVIKAAVGGCPDGFMIDPGGSPSAKSKEDLERISQFVVRFYRNGEKQPSLWQNIEFVDTLRE